MTIENAKEPSLSSVDGLSNVTTHTRSLTKRFVVTGAVTIALIVFLMGCRGYYVLRSTGVESESKRVATRVSELVSMISYNTSNTQSQYIDHIGRSFQHLGRVENVVIYSPELDVLWPIEESYELSTQQRRLSIELLGTKELTSTVIDKDFFAIQTWVDGLFNSNQKLPILIELINSNNETFALAKVDYDFEETMQYARHFGARVLFFSALCSIVLFFVLYKTFRRGIATINQQEQKLTDQIGRLSNLLADNKKLQKSMKTASSRAVELNEQFLRRVGADLHDGPAQMIGFAVLRLNQVSKQDAAKSFGHEFHAVREALNDSLEEIRGISSGLVLPELENMSVEQCLRKVVTLHTVNSKVEVTQFYQDMPEDIALPIKICIYRFVQEGLNNAQRHGQAQKCRLSAYTKKEELVVSLKDNGMGFRKSKLSHDGSHLGLIGLRDRVESLGGTFYVNSELGVGTALKVTLSFAREI